MRKTAYLYKSSVLLGLLFLLLSVSCTIIFLVVKDLSNPLTGGGDIDYWEYTGFYFARNLRLLPLPHLDLINNQSFYPYGTNNVFQPWSFERDISYAITYSFLGIGSWLQIYYVITTVVTAIGSFFLLIFDYGIIRACVLGLLVTLFNFYAIYKYPGHLSYAILHWTTLSLIADFLIVKRVVLRQKLTLQLILIRACLLILSLGQELGYIVGFALMSFTVSIFFIIGILIYRFYKSPSKLSKFIVSSGKTYSIEFLKSPVISFVLICLILVFSWLYIPLVIQISREAKSFDFTGVINGAWWTNPFRLLVPFFPYLNPTSSVLGLFNDVQEDSFGAGSPGWFLLIIGMTGLWQARKHIAIFTPLLIIFVLCLLYHPTDFPTLKVFPWFTFNRVAGRSTVIYPIILGLLALHINFARLRLHSKQLVSTLLLILACTEFITAYSLYLNYQPYLPDNNFFSYMKYVKQQPGEAVLDWPFCVTGGNGVGQRENLCPYALKNMSIFSFRRFYEKKVVGQYFGRLHPSQIEPYLQAGWDKLFVPDSTDTLKATSQSRCFRPQEWEFFTRFYTLNDFAGINLYVELLPKACVQEFYVRFGRHSKEAVLPRVGKVQFIVKSATLRQQVNPALGTRLRFELSPRKS